jgi:hypothetical protein
MAVSPPVDANIALAITLAVINKADIKQAREAVTCYNDVWVALDALLRPSHPQFDQSLWSCSMDPLQRD